MTEKGLHSRLISLPMKTWGRLLAVFIAAAFVLILTILPNFPDTLWGWLGLLILALPILVAAECFGHWFWKNPLATSLSSGKNAHRVSPARLAYGLAVILLACGMAWGMALLLGMK